MKKKLLASISMILLGTMIFAGCSGTNAAGTTSAGEATTTESKPAEEPTKASGKIQVVGSTTIAPPMEELAAKYKETHADANIEIQGVGSSAGIKAANEKTANIGMASRELKEEEKAFGLVETVIAYDGIGVVINPANEVKDLTSEQVKGIFEGTITNWSEVGGADKDIIVVTREDGSGTRSAFEEILKLTQKINDKDVSTITQGALVAEGNGTIKATVGSKEGAVGFLSLGYIDETVKAVSIDGTIATEEEVKAGNYAISRPLLIVTQADADQNIKDFVDFILSTDGQTIVSDKYISVNK